MNAVIHQFKEHTRTDGIVIDTNLLLLLIVGLTDINEVEKHKRTKKFTKKDYELLTNAIAGFDKIICTPYILTEVSNLIAYHTYKSPFLLKIRDVLQSTLVNYIQVEDIVVTDHFLEFGITDSSVFMLAQMDYLVITDDGLLFNYILGNRKFAVNYEHIRQASF